MTVVGVASFRARRAQRATRIWWAVPGAHISLDLIVLIEERERSVSFGIFRIS